MLCRKFRQTLFAKATLKNNVQYQCLIKSRFFSKRCIFFDRVLAYKSDYRVRMSSVRLVWRDLSVARLWSAWTRSFIVNTVVKRCRRERSVREVLQCFRQTILRPRRTFLLSATAAFKSRDDDEREPPSCEKSITDEELEALLSELETAERLSRSTLFCTGCGKRLVIDKRQTAVLYCACKEPKAAEEDPDGWIPYMEAEDVIIWRKEYKPGQGLFAYKVYGRYKEVRAQDFAAVQVDGAYRRQWDAAVAALSVVERRANGVGDQAVLHWEVLWPRLFANRDYVYIRRHKEFDVKSPSSAPGGGVFDSAGAEPPPPAREPERPSVHDRAKRKSQEEDARQTRMPIATTDNKAFIIVSRSCVHPSVPETKQAIRVTEYWSHMVVRSLDGPAETGMEFVLTYYDEPAVGGLPSGVATWATGRAAPAYLAKMRTAAAAYPAWRQVKDHQELPDFTPFGPTEPHAPEDVSLVPAAVREQDMESSKHGPELDNGSEQREQATQTDAHTAAAGVQTDGQGTDEDTLKKLDKVPDVKVAPAVSIPKKEEVPEVKPTPRVDSNPKIEEPCEEQPEKPEEEESTTSNGSWWRYLYPFYYFV